MKPIFAALAVALAGCTTINTHVKDWPTLEIREHEVSWGAIIARCYPSIPLWQKVLGGVPLACVNVNLQAGTCDIYYTPVFGKQHEMEHCLGGDHDGILQAALTGEH